MGGRYDNLVDSKNYTIRIQQIGLVLLSVLLVLALFGWSQSPKKITLHYPPDLTGGVVQTLGTVPKANVYSFTFYVFQQLNRWPDNGTDDYYERIHALKHYTTPACFEERLADFEARERNNELTGRSRAVWEIPGRGFSLDRVKTTSNSSWMVGLDLHVQETFRGERIKDRLIHFPISVVRYDVDPELNPWGLALDCYAGKPRHIHISDEIASERLSPAKGSSS
ncbi:MAG: TIGR03746 family integrating conjugative element protein [Pseudomonadota bacterium]